MIENLCKQIINKHGIDMLHELADGSAAHAYDTGSTEIDIYNSGLRLGVEAAGRPIQEVSMSDYEYSFFFIGEEKEVTAILQEALNRVIE